VVKNSSQTWFAGSYECHPERYGEIGEMRAGSVNDGSSRGVGYILPRLQAKGRGTTQRDCSARGVAGKCALALCTYSKTASWLCWNCRTVGLRPHP